MRDHSVTLSAPFIPFEIFMSHRSKERSTLAYCELTINPNQAGGQRKTVINKTCGGTKKEDCVRATWSVANNTYVSSMIVSLVYSGALNTLSGRVASGKAGRAVPRALPGSANAQRVDPGRKP
jgi:hypothetical protein